MWKLALGFKIDFFGPLPYCSDYIVHRKTWLLQQGFRASLRNPSFCRPLGKLVTMFAKQITLYKSLRSCLLLQLIQNGSQRSNTGISGPIFVVKLNFIRKMSVVEFIAGVYRSQTFFLWLRLIELLFRTDVWMNELKQSWHQWVYWKDVGISGYQKDDGIN